MAQRSEFACHGLAVLVVLGAEGTADRRSPAASRLQAGRVSAGAVPLLPVLGLNPVPASCGTNSFLLTGDVHLNPASRGSPRPLGAGRQASGTIAVTAGSPARAALGPRRRIISEPTRLCAHLSYKKGEQHGGGDSPGIHSRAACPSLSRTCEPSRGIGEVRTTVPSVAASGC